VSLIKKKKYQKNFADNRLKNRQNLLDLERGSYQKKWTDRRPVALLYPNNYHVGMSSLGFQLVYNLLNSQEDLVCERFFFPEDKGSFVSMESARPLSDFSLICISISFEDDYVNLVQMLLAAGITPFSEDREKNISKDSPLVLCGGVISMINPEPIAPFVDLFYVGEGEVELTNVVDLIFERQENLTRDSLLHRVAENFSGCYVPGFYKPVYDDNGRQIGFDNERGLPSRIKKYCLDSCEQAAHSQLLTPETEFSDLYLTELGRGCSRGCRFCTAGFIYRPPRLWSADAVVEGLKKRFDGVKRVGLLGMEMAATDDLATISQYLIESGCALSFSSLRADRLNSDLINLLEQSNLKSVAIAPDGCSERLRLVINKSLSENDILSAAEKLVGAGIFKLKLYLMIGLPTETDEDLQEAVSLVGKIKETIDAIGRQRGRLCEIVVSVNCFSPKPWTPLQYHPFGISQQLQAGETRSAKEAVSNLKYKLKYLKKGLTKYPNVTVNSDKPENVLFQAVLAKGDRRLADVIYLMALHGAGWKLAMKKVGLSPEEYAVTGLDDNSFLVWEIIDHSLKSDYLWKEYKRSFEARLTDACRTGICRKCGVCGEE